MKMKLFLPVAVFLFALNSCISQKKSTSFEVSSQLLNSPANFASQPEKYLEWQSGQLLDVSEKALMNHSPRLQESMERHMALLMLDAVFHDVEAPNRPSVQEFHKRRTLHALEEMGRILSLL